MLLWKSQRIIQILCPHFSCVDAWRTFFNLEIKFNLICFISSKSFWNDPNQLFILQIQFNFFFLLHFLLRQTHNKAWWPRWGTGRTRALLVSTACPCAGTEAATPQPRTRPLTRSCCGLPHPCAHTSRPTSLVSASRPATAVAAAPSAPLPTPPS